MGSSMHGPAISRLARTEEPAMLDSADTMVDKEYKDKQGNLHRALGRR